MIHRTTSLQIETPSRALDLELTVSFGFAYSETTSQERALIAQRLHDALMRILTNEAKR